MRSKKTLFNSASGKEFLRRLIIDQLNATDGYLLPSDLAILIDFGSLGRKLGRNLRRDIVGAVAKFTEAILLSLSLDADRRDMEMQPVGDFLIRKTLHRLMRDLRKEMNKLKRKRV